MAEPIMWKIALKWRIKFTIGIYHSTYHREMNIWYTDFKSMKVPTQSVHKLQME